jgi:hypothetical protein
MCDSRIYSEWRNLIQRCVNKKATNYERYGGRGITVCNEWKESFINFNTWAEANGYEDSLTIDRINNDGSYEPKNCRWITQKEQNRNKSNNNLITYKGKTKCLTDWAVDLGIGCTTLYYRLKRDNWDVELSFFTGINEVRSNSVLTKQDANQIRKLHRMQRYSYAEVGKIFEVDRSLVRQVVLNKIWKEELNER